jgi:hypothetical protein
MLRRHSPVEVEIDRIAGMMVAPWHDARRFAG